MMIYLLSTLLFLQVISDEVGSKASLATKERKSAAVASSIAAAGDTRSIMMIDPKQRAADYVRAWESLKMEKSTAKVAFTLADGSEISNIIDIKPMPNDTLVLFRYTSPKGVLFQVVEIENITGITHK